MSKYAVEEIYKNNGRNSLKIFMVTDDHKSAEKFTDDFDYYLDVFDTLDEAKTHSPKAVIESGLEPA